MRASLSPRSTNAVPAVDRAMLQGGGVGGFFKQDQTQMHVYAVPLRHGGESAGALAVFYEATYIEARNAQIWQNTFFHVLGQMLVVGAIPLLLVPWIDSRALPPLAHRLH